MIGLKPEIISRYPCFLSIFLIQFFLMFSVVDSTTVQPSLKTTTEASTTLNTSTTPKEVRKFFGPRDSNSPITTLKKMDTVTPTTTVTNEKFDQLSICYPVEDILTDNTKTTQHVQALTRAMASSKFTDTPEISFVDWSLALTLQPSENREDPQVKWVNSLETNPSTTTVTTTSVDAPGTNTSDWIVTLTLQAGNVYGVENYSPSPYYQFKVTAAILQSNSTVAPKIEPAKNKVSSANNYRNAELLGYAELATNPFSKYLELCLERLDKLSELLAIRFFLMFANKILSLAQDGNFDHFGPTTTQFMTNSANQAVKMPKEYIKQLIHSYYIRILHRREVLNADPNALLDYMDMLYTYEDELAMEKILMEFLAFPNVNRTVIDIVGDTVSKVIIKPSWRLIVSGKPKGQMLFEYMSNIISGHTDPNSNSEKKIAQLIKRNNEYMKKNIKGRIKIVCEVTSPTKQIEKNKVTKAIKRRNIDFERAWTRTMERAKFKYSSKAYKTGSVYKHYNVIPTEAYWNVNRDVKIDNKLSSMRSQNQNPKSKFHELYQKNKRNKKENIDSNIRQRVSFKVNYSEFAPFNVNTKAPNVAIFDNIEVHKNNVTKTPDYVRMQPTTIGNTADYIEIISLEIKNISNLVNIGMKLQFQRTASPHSKASPKPSENFVAKEANSEPTMNAVSSNNAVRTWNPYKMDKYFEKIKDASNDAKQNMLPGAKSTVEADKEMSIFDSHDAFTRAKGTETQVLDEIKYAEITGQRNKYDEHAYRNGKHHAKRQRDKHKMHKLGRRESIIKQLRKGKQFNKKRRERKLRNYRQRYNNIDKYNRKNDVDIWEYYLKRSKVTNRSDTENLFDSSLDSEQESLLTEHKKNEITSNGDNTNKDMEILWYKKDKYIVDQSTILQSSKPRKEIESYKKINGHSTIKEYEDVMKTFSEGIQKIKLSTQIQINKHKLTDNVAKVQKKKDAYHTKKSSQKVKPQKILGINDIFGYTLLADVDGIKQQVGKNIEYNEDKYYKRKKLLKKLPHIAKTPTSPKDRGVKSGSHANKQGDKAHNLYIKDLKVHKNLIDVRCNLDDLRRYPEDSKDALRFSTVNALVDSAYSDEEKELKNNLYDSFRHADRTFFRRNLNHDSTPKSGLRDDSEYTDTEIVLKQMIYKSIKNTM